jgi:two-component system, NtrC family, response regulator GlrR
MLGCSREHRQTLQLVAAAAATDAEVLILGPTGVGKELYARRVHEESRRSSRQFVAVNCGALPPDLFENELFGHVAGAFTGARPRAIGLVNEAEGGTLFLDEIDSLHIANQVKLLRLIQEKEYRPLGEPRIRRVNVRVVAATNVDLRAETREGRFRSDLFFRLRVIPIEIAPLKDRPEDIPPLLDHFLQRYAEEYGVSPVVLSDPARARLFAYSWPGNVRELENCARYLLCTRPGSTIHVGDLPLLSESEDDAIPALVSTSDEPLQKAKRRIVEAFERQYLERALSRSNGNIAAAARASGKHRRAFFELMRRHGLARSCQ